MYNLEMSDQLLYKRDRVQKLQMSDNFLENLGKDWDSFLKKQQQNICDNLVFYLEEGVLVQKDKEILINLLGGLFQEKNIYILRQSVQVLVLLRLLAQRDFLRQIFRQKIIDYLYVEFVKSNCGFLSLGESTQIMLVVYELKKVFFESEQKDVSEFLESVIEKVKQSVEQFLKRDLECSGREKDLLGLGDFEKFYKSGFQKIEEEVGQQVNKEHRNLIKLLFIFQKIGVEGVGLMEQMANRISIGSLQILPELEITSFLYAVIKIKDFDLRMKEAIENIYLQKVEQGVRSGSIPFQRIPYILYVFGSISSLDTARIFENLLSEILQKNIQKFEMSEFCTILYAEKKMHVEEKYILEQVEKYFEEDKKYQEIRQVDYLVIFMALRNTIQKNQLEKNPRVRNVLEKILKQFLSQKNLVQDSIKIRVVYEIAHNSKFISKNQFLEEFQLWIIEIQLRTLNTHDLIALGNLMKKFIRVTHEHFYFWHKFIQAVKEKKIDSSQIFSAKKIHLILSSVHDFLNKCLTSRVSANNKKNHEIQLLLDKIMLLEKTLLAQIQTLNVVQENFSNNNKNQQNNYYKNLKNKNQNENQNQETNNSKNNLNQTLNKDDNLIWDIE